MYTTLLFLHSLTRWFVLASLVYAIYRGYRGWISALPFTSWDNSVRHNTATIAHIQLILGICLYFISPLTTYFLHYYSTAVHDREIRFFGMEHITVMILAIAVITIGSIRAKRAVTDGGKFKTMAIFYTIALLMILSSVPWPFSPLVSRPYLRLW